METREALNKGIEQMMAGAIRRTDDTKLAAEKLCNKCGSRWWEQRKALVRDVNRGGAASKFNTTVFEYFICVGCGKIEIPDNAVQVSRDLRLYYADFIKTLQGQGKHKAMQAEDVFPHSRETKVEEPIEEEEEEAAVEEVEDTQTPIKKAWVEAEKEISRRKARK